MSRLTQFTQPVAKAWIIQIVGIAEGLLTFSGFLPGLYLFLPELFPGISGW